MLHQKHILCLDSFHCVRSVTKKIFAGGDKPEIVSEVKTDELNIPIYANAVKNNGLDFLHNPKSGSKIALCWYEKI